MNVGAETAMELMALLLKIQNVILIVPVGRLVGLLKNIVELNGEILYIKMFIVKI